MDEQSGRYSKYMVNIRYIRVAVPYPAQHLRPTAHGEAPPYMSETRAVSWLLAQTATPMIESISSNEHHNEEYWNTSVFETSTLTSNTASDDEMTRSHMNIHI